MIPLSRCARALFPGYRYRATYISSLPWPSSQHMGFRLLPSITRLFASSAVVSTSGISSSDPVPATMSSSAAQKSESEWRAILSKEQFRVLREKGTERAGTGEYEHHKADGVYACAGCGTPLYTSNTKFSSGCGWPAFFDAIPGAVTRHEDRSWGMTRIEITCTACGGHLGHVFKGEGFKTPTDERHCVNSVSLKFDDKPAE